MTEKTVGWLFVAAQAVLLIAIILIPGADHWDRPGWLMTLASVLTVAGIVIIAMGAFGLGSALTPTPVPRQTGELQTDGLYRLVRHPVYTGVLLAVCGVALGSGNLVQVVLLAATFGFFTVKARWEEQRLLERYPEYAAYAARTSRFFPGLRTNSGSDVLTPPQR